jgi:hypothetical protein
MSALGHKQTYAVQQDMSALPPIATMKADSRKRCHGERRVLYARHGNPRTWFFSYRKCVGITCAGMSAHAYLAHITVSDRPWTPGQIRTSRNQVNGARLSFGAPGAIGTVHAQIRLRGFGATAEEVAATMSKSIDSEGKNVDIALPKPLVLNDAFATYTVEPCLVWNGIEPLRLKGPPEIY